MSRERKFRAWVKPLNKMVEVEEIDFVAQGQIAYDEIEYRYTAKEPFHYTQWVDFEDIELMQYTSLKDKNGVEIFEGDIVKCKIGNVDFKGYVYFYGGRFEFIDFEDDEETEFLCYCDELEVIGNIYENKELLNE